MEQACCQPHQVVVDFYDKVMGYVSKRVDDTELAKDITQEVMGRMMDAYQRGLAVENTQAWLFGVTRNIIADRYRKKDLLDFKDFEPEVSKGGEGFSLQAEDFILPMIRLLPEEYSIPLYMSDIENKKQAEIAEHLGLSLSATKMRCQRARKKLHDMFLECCDIEYTATGSFAGCTLKSSCDVLLREEENMKGKLSF